MDRGLNLGCVDLRFGDGLDGRRQIGGNVTTPSRNTAADGRGGSSHQGEREQAG